MQKVDLCGPCVAVMKTGYEVRKVSQGVDNKITCAKCGRRRYGGTYEIGKQEEKGEK